MLKAILAAALIIALAPVQEVNRVIALTDLTVPPSRLPPGCALLEIHDPWKRWTGSNRG